MVGSCLSGRSWWWSWECVPSLCCSRVGGEIGDGAISTAGRSGERDRCCERGWAGWDALLAAMRRRARGGVHGGVIECGDVDVITHDGAGAVGGTVVTADHDPGGGRQVDERRTH